MATDRFWTNDDADNSYANALNWEDDTKPGVGENAVFNDAKTGDNCTIDEATAALASFDADAYTGAFSGAGNVTASENIIVPDGAADAHTGSWAMTGAGTLEGGEFAELVITGTATLTDEIHLLVLSGDGALILDGNHIFFSQFASNFWTFTGTVTADDTSIIWLTSTGNRSQSSVIDVDDAQINVNFQDRTLTQTANLSCGDLLVRGTAATKTATLDLNSGAKLHLSGELLFGVNGNDHKGIVKLGTGLHRLGGVAMVAGSTATHELQMEDAPQRLGGTLDGTDIVITLTGANSAVINGIGTAPTVQNIGQGTGSIDNDIDCVGCTNGGNNDAQVSFVDPPGNALMLVGIG